MKSLSIIGCGKLGKTLGKLFADSGLIKVNQILTRSLKSAEEARHFIHAGTPVSSYEELEPADYIMLAVPDDQIEGVAKRLLISKMLGKSSLVFHCSGACTSEVLLLDGDCIAGSFHPIKSFSDPSSLIASFKGTYIAVEGDPAAIFILKELSEMIDGIPMVINAEEKLRYHAGTVFASNGLVSLLEVSLQCLEKSGIERNAGMKILEPLVRGTVDSFFTLGSVDALTGPVSRGESGVIEKQLASLSAWNEDVSNLYRYVGLVAASLTEKKEQVPVEILQAIRNILQSTRT
jgi:predicted short-subunit dehydrogenase-like oxidoreductase (DUF2520 family)